jgi:uncharacterized protein (TIGR04255 family)
MLTLDPVPEVPLATAPLLQVICQVRFSDTPALVADQNSVALADALVSYPVGRTVQGLNIVVGSAGEPTTIHQPIRQFSSTDGSWQVSVAEGFVSLETTKYTNRTDFCDRMVATLNAVSSVARPPVLDRVGLRYIDRWSEPEVLRDITRLIERPVLGIYGEIGAGLTLEHTIGQHMLAIDSGGQIQMRSGYIPAQGTLDQAIPAIGTASWILDIDVFQEWRPVIGFEVELIDTAIRTFAGHAHSVFRWATTAEFIKRYRKAEGTQ